MEFQEFKNLVSQIKYGKSLPDAIYLHESAMVCVPPELHAYVFKVIGHLKLQDTKWNIVKFFKKDFKLSLLDYPTFFDESYPTLFTSHTIDLEKYVVRSSNYQKSENPPILHRKEAFLLPAHPAVPNFEEITKEGEEAGLYENSRKIGFKRTWEQLIASKGLRLENGRLVSLQKGDESSPQENNVRVERHRTAIDRNSLSSPMQTLFRHNFFEGNYSVLDYGCGKGDDIRILEDHGIQAIGWDPIYRPDEKPRPADIVNLGFVINVIEDPKERRDTLKKAYKLSQKVLAVSVMLGGESITSQFKPHGDGVITSRNTFQKYYSQNEFRSYLEGALDESAIAVSPGIFYVFKDKLEEQKFLVEREKIKRNWQRLTYKGDPDKLKIKQRALIEIHKELLEDFWTLCLDLGRLPANPEFDRSEELRALCGSHQKALRILLNYHGENVFNGAVKARRDDLLVYFALGLFSRRRPYVHMPDTIKRDIKDFFGKYTDAIEEAKGLLFSVGKPENIQRECEDFYAKVGKGYLQEGHSLTIHRAFLEQLPPTLRVYIGCASQLYGDVETVDLIKIHIRSGKVSLMRYDDFEGKPLPLLMERIKIKLREQDIDFFEYGAEFKPQPVYQKSIYLSENMPNYVKQVSFDKKLLKFQWLNISKYGPPYEDFVSNLNMEGLEVRGFNFYRVSNHK